MGAIHTYSVLVKFPFNEVLFQLCCGCDVASSHVDPAPDINIKTLFIFQPANAAPGECKEE